MGWQDAPIVDAPSGGQAPQQGWRSAPEIVATTPDGGEVYRMSDGTLSYKSSGYATTDQAIIARIMEGATPKEEVQRGFDEQRIAANPIAARVQEFNQGAPLVGEWLDEAVGVVSPEAAKNMNLMSDAMERQRPGQSAALNIAGSVAYTAPALAFGSGIGPVDKAGQATKAFVQGGKGLLGQATRAGLVAAPAGAVEGGLSFAGRADKGERIDAGKTGALVGGGLAATMGVFAPVLGAGVTSLVKRVKALDVKTIAEQFGVSRAAARVLRGYIQNDDLANAGAVLARNSDAMLAESGPGTRQALDTAMSSGGGALSVARGRVDERVQSVAGSWAKTLDDVLGSADGGIKGAAKDISRSTSAGRRAAYDFAYNQPTPRAGAGGQALDDVLARIDPEDFRSAARQAEKMARDEGRINLNIMAIIDDAGNIDLEVQPSVLELDYLARGLNNLVDAGTDKLTGQMSPDARLAFGQAKALRDVLKEHVNGYARALKLGGDKIQQTNALVMGRKLLSASTTREEVRDAMRDASDDVVAAARRGVRENIEAIMSRARTTIADLEAGNMDFDTGTNQVAEAVAAVRNLLNKDNFQKMSFVLGADAKRLYDELEKVGDALVLRAAVARGSATAIRQSGQAAIADEVAPGLVRQTAADMGNPLEAARGLTQTAVGVDARSISREQQGYFTEIADALTRIKGPEAQRALIAVRRALAGQPMRDAEAELISRLLTGGAAVAGYQSGKQAIGPQ